ncbi:restriction endonuclease subunit S [Aeromonas media]|uniref:restriction endonuclease subunit S n=1 Tax=Aeromonas media TaxID=651 RepID=UPI00370C2087
MAAQKIENLITDHLDLWTAAVRPKSSAGRGSNSKLELTGIKKLRELILELAVRGKLVPQDPSDGPASVLLARIAAAKAQLVKDGKIKKPKALPEISEEEKPFELPEGWVCIRLGDLTSKMGSGSTPRGGQSAYVSEGIPFLRSQNVWNEGLRLDDVVYIDENTHLKMEGTKVIPGDVLLNITGASLGRALIFPDSIKEANVSQHVTIIRLLIDELAPFVHLGIKSPLVQDLIWGRQVGMAIEGLSKRTLELFEFPIPPLAEQHRIVAKVDELMALCDQLEQLSELQLAAHQTLVETLLATLTDSADADELAQNWARLTTHFDTLFTTDASIDALKQTILQLAVMGKLVPQDPSDEPASALLERIAAEKAQLVKEKKIKKEKPLPAISEDEKPFELPKGWEWCRLPDLGELARGKSKHRPRNDPKLYVNGTIPLVQTGDVARADGLIESYTAMYNEIGLAQSQLWPKGTLCITIAANIADTGILGFDACFPDSVVGYTPYESSLPVVYFDFFIRTAKENLERFAPSTAQKNINLEILSNILVPCPPTQEFIRIVSRVNDLFAICDQLKSRLQTSQQTQLVLAESLVEGALA